jgi:hypothetical protein
MIFTDNVYTIIFVHVQSIKIAVFMLFGTFKTSPEKIHTFMVIFYTYRLNFKFIEDSQI